ncbi:hypothetical protein IGI04_028480 [Brassica rapa subsp. trilocularis]|uniref:CRABS CLAW n=1 Tax=Brassica rapa subsp. trilocularis TaxID=1813537 RepID=A0ABQ7L5E8_BRACM|nr:hypothetical protein IGI04_028480 [Brassica rapa subsp. trilocularis]
MNLEEKPTMASRVSPQAEHLYYVRCSICNTILAVGIPMKRMLDTVTVKCGHCGNLSFLTTTPPLQGHVSLTLQKQRLPSAYNRFMRDEIQRIKSANPEIPHREAFSAAAKNWAKYIPNSPTSITSGASNIHGFGFGEKK